MKYDVFISYSRKDYVDEHKNIIPGNEVSKIIKALTDAGISYWIDEEGIYYGQNFVEKIVTNIDASKIFLFISSANSNNSKWTCREIANADDKGKLIIPIRIDSSPYHEIVNFRISNLQHIDYYKNPEKEIANMVEEIKAYLEQEEVERRKKEKEEQRKKEEEQKKAEEEKRKREQEEQRRVEEQKRIVDEIEIAYKKLKNEEEKIVLERENLILRTQKISNEVKRSDLQSSIKNSSPIRQVFQEERADLLRKLNDLNISVQKAKEENVIKSNVLKQKERRIVLLEGKLKDAESKKTQIIEKPTTKHFHIAYFSLILFVTVISCVWIAKERRQSQAFEQQLKADEIELEPYRKAEREAKARRQAEARGELTVNGVSFKMIPVEGGEFQMGKKSKVKESAHSVKVDSFYIGETEVTQELWEAVMGTSIYKQRDKADTSWKLRGVGANYPMYYINHQECTAFIDSLNSKKLIEGWKFRLPTEAEWEYAARGGNKSEGKLYAGDNILGVVGWYDCNSDSTVHPVKSLRPNELGLYDMSGNLWEWCQDWYESGYSKHSETDNPIGPSSGKFRVLRGGSWHYIAEGCQVFFRGSDSPESRYTSYGFRLVMVPVKTQEHTIVP